MSGTSTIPGYLKPLGDQPPYGQALENIFHDLIVGITGLAPQHVRPSWQPEPPQQPAPNTDWSAFAVGILPTQEFPEMDYQTLIHHEWVKVLVSFYGPNAQANMALVRDGLYVEQNRASLIAQNMSFIAHDEAVRLPILINVQWVDRYDLPLTFRRSVERVYNIQTITTLGTGNPIITSNS